MKPFPEERGKTRKKHCEYIFRNSKKARKLTSPPFLVCFQDNRSFTCKTNGWGVLFHGLEAQTTGNRILRLKGRTFWIRQKDAYCYRKAFRLDLPLCLGSLAVGMKSKTGDLPCLAVCNVVWIDKRKVPAIAKMAGTFYIHRKRMLSIFCFKKHL